MPSQAPVAGSHWLSDERLRVYPWLFLLVWVGIAIWWTAQFPGGRAAGGHPWGADYIALWSAGHLALTGDAVAAWSPARLFEAQQLAIPGNTSHYGWFYPPAALLLVSPLALLPYLLSWLVAMTGSLLLWLRVLRRELPHPGAWPWLLAFPAVLANLQYGQSGPLTAAIACLALTALARRPGRAGVLLALLTLKPQLLAVTVVLLLATRNWRALATLSATTLLLVLASLLLWGIEPWLIWPDALRLAGRLTGEGALPWTQMPTLFAGLRLWQVPASLALLLHALLALSALTMALLIWLRHRDAALRGSAAVLATLLFSPYLFDYELIWLALPLLWLTRLGLRDGWWRGERELLVLAWLQPFLGPLLMQAWHLPSAPPILFALLLMTWRRHRVSAERLDASGPADTPQTGCQHGQRQREIK